MEALEIRPAASVAGRVRVPGSKSLTLRALTCAALGDGDSTISGALFSSDSVRMAQALRQMGATIDEHEGDNRFEVRGIGGAPRVEDARLDVADCGTCMRILAALAASGTGRFVLDGTDRMRRRPIGGLGRALTSQGVGLRYQGRDGCAPVAIEARGLTGGEVRVDAGESSQYVTALLLAAPMARTALAVTPIGTFPSQPYVALTLETMAAFGIDVRVERPRFEVPQGVYRGRDHSVEGDYSSASYFFAAAAITGGTVEVVGLRHGSSQGDRRFLDYLQALGSRVTPTADGVRVEGGDRPGDIEFDFADCPDIVPTAAVVAAYHDGRVTTTGAPHLRLKESDRIRTVCDEIRRMGGHAEERDDGVIVDGRRPLRGAQIDTHDDHRIAMSFAVAGLRTPGVVLRDPGCTAKSYPAFFDDLERIVRR